MQSLGLHTLQAENPEKKPEELSNCSSKMYIAGTILFVSASLCNFAAFAFAPQSLLASLEAVQFVSNIAFGKFLLGSIVLFRMYVGTGCIVGGTILIVLFSSKGGDPWTVEMLMENYLRTDYQIFLGVMVFVAVVFYTITDKLHKINENKQAITWHNIVEPVTYATFSAVFGTQAVVQAK